MSSLSQTDALAFLERVFGVELGREPAHWTWSYSPGGEDEAAWLDALEQSGLIEPASAIGA